MALVATIVAIFCWPVDLSAWAIFVWSGRALGVLFVPSVLLQRSTRPMAALTWILALLFLPYLGAVLWWMLGRNHFRRHRRRHSRSQARISESFHALEKSAHRDRSNSSTEDENIPLLDTALVARRLILQDEYGLFPPTPHNRVTFHPSSEKTFQAFRRAIEEATDHVHFQFYIWKPDDTGTVFRDLLAKKARQGLEVRVLYDAVGSMRIRRPFLQPLVDAGAEVAVFSPVHLWERRLRVNFRNHRKLLIVDGRCGFTGGVNIADEYLDWFDTSCGFQGPVVHQMQEVFAEDWYFATGENLAYRRYFPGLEKFQKPRGRNEERTPDSKRGYLPESHIVEDVAAQLVASGPDDRVDTIHKSVVIAIHSAVDRLQIITPYFVPDDSVLTALQIAALRGVDVRLIVPAQADIALTQHAGRSFWEPLLEAGGRIYEYEPRVLHTKLMVVDDTHSFVGSANLDVRSFRLNFEANVIIENADFAKQMSHLFESALEDSREICLQDFRSRSRRTRLQEGVARLFSPLL